MKSLHITLLIATALIFASCHKQIVIVQPVGAHCAYDLEGHVDKGDHAGCPHHLPDDNPYCRCGVRETLDESAIPPQDDKQSCGCVVQGAGTCINWGFGDVPREVREQVLKDIHELHFLCGVKTKADDGTVLLPDVGNSCGCGVKGAQTVENPPGVPIYVIEDPAVRAMPDMIAPQCMCGVGIKDEGDAGLNTIQRKAILEQGLKLLDRDAESQPEAAAEPTELEVLRLPQGEEIQIRRERFDAWKTAWIANVENRLRAAEDRCAVIEVLDAMFDEMEAPLMPFYSDETHAAMEREIQGGDEMTPEETTRLESEINHALETLGISDDYMAEMLDHVRMTVKKLGIDMESDAEDK